MDRSEQHKAKDNRQADAKRYADEPRPIGDKLTIVHGESV